MDEVNLNYGIDYNRFQSNSIYSLIGINNGWTTRSNINLTSNVMKKKIALTLYGFYNGPLYTLINQIKVRPYIGFDAETSLLKNKLNISLSYNNIFAWNANRTEKSTSHNFNQIISTRNNTSNVLLSLSYFFGKKFSSSIANSTVENDDIIIK